MMKKENLSADQIDKIMNKESGVLGLSGKSSDHRDIED
jgi:acetate kinase